MSTNSLQLKKDILKNSRGTTRTNKNQLIKKVSPNHLLFYILLF